MKIVAKARFEKRHQNAKKQLKAKLSCRESMDLPTLRDDLRNFEHQTSFEPRDDVENRKRKLASPQVRLKILLQYPCLRTIAGFSSNSASKSQASYSWAI
jgi:hypothetical protein